MTFNAPIWLLLLVPVVAMAIVYLVQHRRRSRYAIKFAALPMLDKLVPEKPGWRRHVPAAALLLAFACLAFATARPEVQMKVPREEASVVVALDVSLSMKAEDVDPDRITAAKAAAKKFIEDLPDTINVGLVTFAGSASVLAPPTTDHELVASTLDGVQLANRTAIGEAVFTSLDILAPLTEQAKADGKTKVPARIVLLSDGTNTVGRSVESAVEASLRADVPVSTIAFGSQDGTVMTEGQRISVPVDEATLAGLAEQSGGKAYTAESGDELSEVYDDIGSSIGFTTEPREITSYFSAAALLLGLLAAFLSFRWFARFP